MTRRIIQCRQDSKGSNWTCGWNGLGITVIGSAWSTRSERISTGGAHRLAVWGLLLLLVLVLLLLNPRFCKSMLLDAVQLQLAVAGGHSVQLSVAGHSE